MHISVNGRPREAPAGATVGAWLRAQGLDPRRVAVAVNAAVVPRAELDRRALAEGDAVEVIEPVGGG